MADLTVLHNSRCSTSRHAVEAVDGAGVQAQVVHYLKTPLDREQLLDLIGKLEDPPADLVRKDAFFTELGLTLEGRTTVEGEWAERVTGLRDMRCEIAMMITPDGHSRLELSRFEAPPIVSDHRRAPVNALGYLRIMFTVEDLDDMLDRLYGLGAELVDEVVQYGDTYRLCYIRGPEGLLIGLAQELESQAL